MVQIAGIGSLADVDAEVQALMQLRSEQEANNRQLMQLITNSIISGAEFAQRSRQAARQFGLEKERLDLFGKRERREQEIFGREKEDAERLQRFLGQVPTSISTPSVPIPGVPFGQIPPVDVPLTFQAREQRAMDLLARSGEEGDFEAFLRLRRGQLGERLTAAETKLREAEARRTDTGVLSMDKFVEQVSSGIEEGPNRDRAANLARLQYQADPFSASQNVTEIARDLTELASKEASGRKLREELDVQEGAEEQKRTREALERGAPGRDELLERLEKEAQRRIPLIIGSNLDALTESEARTFPPQKGRLPVLVQVVETILKEAVSDRILDEESAKALIFQRLNPSISRLRREFKRGSLSREDRQAVNDLLILLGRKPISETENR